MPELERPDGVRIHYEVRGEGPLVVMTLGFMTPPSGYRPMVEDLARDRRVVTWDVRGCGGSAPTGPYTVSADSDDLAALIAALGGQAVVFAAGHGVNISAHAAARDPDAVAGLVAHGITTALLDDLSESEGIGTSRSVIEMLIEQFRRDPRGAIRQTVRSLNPQMTEDEVRDRVEATLRYAPAEASLSRLESWLADNSALDELRDLGERLVVVKHESDWWQRGTIEPIAELLPRATVRELEDGPLSRPDLAAACVRSMA